MKEYSYLEAVKIDAETWMYKHQDRVTRIIENNTIEGSIDLEGVKGDLLDALIDDVHVTGGEGYDYGIHQPSEFIFGGDGWQYFEELTNQDKEAGFDEKNIYENFGASLAANDWAYIDIELRKYFLPFALDNICKAFTDKSSKKSVLDYIQKNWSAKKGLSLPTIKKEKYNYFEKVKAQTKTWAQKNLDKVTEIMEDSGDNFKKSTSLYDTVADSTYGVFNEDFALHDDNAMYHIIYGGGWSYLKKMVDSGGVTYEHLGELVVGSDYVSIDISILLYLLKQWIYDDIDNIAKLVK